MTIALLVDSVTGISGYQEAVWLGVTDEASERGIRVRVFSGGALDVNPLNPFEKTRNIIYELCDLSSLDGVILCGGTIGNGTTRERFESFCGRFSGKPSVSVGSAGPSIPRVLVDNDQGMREIVKHLIVDHGYSRFGCVTGPKGNIDADRRRDMFVRTLREHGVPVIDELIVEGDFNDRSGIAAVERWMDASVQLPDAIVASNDNMAFGVLSALEGRGVSVPYTVAVTGFDDVAEADTSSPPLSTVRQPIYAQARKAVGLLVDRINGKGVPFETLEPPVQVYRQSCGCLSASVRAFGEGFESSDGGPASGPVGGPASGSASSSASSEHDLITRVANLPVFAGRPERVREGARLISLAASVDCDERAFFASLHALVRGDIAEDRDLTPWLLFVDLLRKEARGNTALVHRAHSFFSDLSLQRLHRSRAAAARETALLMAAEREIIASFDFDILKGAVVKAISSLGLADAVIALFEDPRNPTGRAKTVAAFANGREIDCAGVSFDAPRLVPERTELSSLLGAGLVVAPLCYRDDALGFLVLGQKSRKGLVYESLASQISSAVEGATLIQRVLKAEKDIEDRSRRIEALMRPMLESIGSVARLSTDQSAAVGRLAELNRASVASVREMEANAKVLADSLQKTGALVADIESISEVINVVAINASIEAAHVGKAGAGFAVIAGEVRKLSEVTRRNSGEIAGFLSELGQRMSLIDSSNATLSAAFGELNAMIESTVSTLGEISSRMERLDRGSNDILGIMN